MDTPRLTHLKIEDYKAFGRAEIELAPLTFVLGRNNAGKSALCRAPVFFTEGLRSAARTPFPIAAREIDFGNNLLDICFQKRLTGLGGTLTFGSGADAITLSVGAIAPPERGFQQLPKTMSLKRTGQVLFEMPTDAIGRPEMLPWKTLQQAMLERASAEQVDLSKVPEQIEILLGVRDLPRRGDRWLGYPPTSVGPKGAETPGVLAAARIRNDEAAFDALNAWTRRALGVSVDVRIDQQAGSADVLVSPDATGHAVHLVDSGAGIAQILPLVVALKILPDSAQPQLYIIEQPELHLHPRAHAEVAELLIEAASKPEGPWLLVETHSDPLLLRVRAALAEERLSPDQVRLYFVDDSGDPAKGSVVRPIPLNDRGTPAWWPKGIFAEPQDEFLRIRRALAKRDRRG